MGLYSLEDKTYHPTIFDEDLELTSLLGNINTMDGEHYSHLHATFGNAEGKVVGGHLSNAVISVTGEIFIRVIDGRVDRKLDEEIGINLFEF